MFFNQCFVDDAAWIRVTELASSFIFDKEALGDTLVHHYYCDFGFVGGLVVHVVDGSFELRDLVRQNLVSLGIADTVSVDNDVGGVFFFMVLRESSNRSHHSLFHLGLHNLFTLLLDNVLRVVLTHLFIDAAAETNHRFRTSVANINTDQHSAFLVKHFWELEVVQVTTSLTVYLFDYVGGFGEVELASIA